MIYLHPWFSPDRVKYIATHKYAWSSRHLFCACRPDGRRASHTALVVALFIALVCGQSQEFCVFRRVIRRVSNRVTLPSQVRPSDYQSDLDNRCLWCRYEKEGVRASWIFIMTSPVYWLWYGGHTQVRLSDLQELGREEGGSELIAHIRDIKESAGSRQLDRWRWIAFA